jgi:hypothetical protein
MWRLIPSENPAIKAAIGNRKFRRTVIISFYIKVYSFGLN